MIFIYSNNINICNQTRADVLRKSSEIKMQFLKAHCAHNGLLENRVCILDNKQSFSYTLQSGFVLFCIIFVFFFV